MKMTKIESARIIAESTDNPVCRSILCSKCFNSRKGKTCKDGNLVAIEKAKAYIKRHESKSKKKDHILDTTKKVEEPKPIKTVGIDNSDVTLAQHEPTVKENLSVPQPVKFEDEVPEYVYIVTNNAVLRREVVQFVHQRYNTQKPDMFILTVGGSTMSFEECYRTPEEALVVAKKLWNKEVTE